MTGTTDTQFSPFTETFGDTLTQLVDGAAKVARESTKSYVAGLNAIVKQQRFAYDASQQWVSAVVSAQSNIRQQLVESYDSAKGQLVNTAEDATKPAGEAGVDVAESSRDAARAPRKQSRPVTKTSRRSAPTKSKPASTNGRRPGPAKWTNEAYEALTAVEVIDKKDLNLLCHRLPFHRKRINGKSKAPLREKHKPLARRGPPETVRSGQTGSSQLQQHAAVAQGVRFHSFETEELRHALVIGTQQLRVDIGVNRCLTDLHEAVLREEVHFEGETENATNA